MQILLANAKIMYDRADRQPLSAPLFQSVASQLAAEMARMDIKELSRQLDCSRKLAAENWKRYQDFSCAEAMPVIIAYYGQAYKQLKAFIQSDDTVWLSLDQMAELFQRNKSTITRHIKNVFEEGELRPDSTVAFFATTTQHGAFSSSVTANY